MDFAMLPSAPDARAAMLAAWGGAMPEDSRFIGISHPMRNLAQNDLCQRELNTLNIRGRFPLLDRHHCVERKPECEGEEIAIGTVNSDMGSLPPELRANPHQ